MWFRRVLFRSDRTATLLSVGTSSLSSCTRFPAISEALTATPVMLPPGCPRFGTRPISTGAYTAKKTMGIDVVALLAAIAPAEVRARMTAQKSDVWGKRGPVGLGSGGGRR